MIPDARAIARALGGEVAGQQVLAPGPGHSRLDRSLSIRIEPGAPAGFIGRTGVSRGLEEHGLTRRRSAAKQRSGRAARTITIASGAPLPSGTRGKIHAGRWRKLILASTASSIWMMISLAAFYDFTLLVRGEMKTPAILIVSPH